MKYVRIAAWAVVWWALAVALAPLTDPIRAAFQEMLR